MLIFYKLCIVCPCINLAVMSETNIQHLNEWTDFLKFDMEDIH
jgi:hypothetical protein